MIRKILGVLLCILFVRASIAQSYLVPRSVIKQNISSGYFMQKPGTTAPDDAACINVAEAKSLLYLNESVLPTDGRMPWWSELVPLKTLPCSGTSYLLCATSFVSYSSCGSYIYTSFNSKLTTFQRTKIAATNSFWISDASYCTTTPPTTASVASVATASTFRTADTSAKLRTAAAVAAAAALPGPLNRCGVWPTCNGATGPVNQWIGISRTITVPSTKTYYVGVAADNVFRLVIDGTLIVEYGLDINPFAYRIWNILPVTLTAGVHTLIMDAEDLGAPGVLGVEIYDNTAAQIAAATSYSGLNLIFSTKDIPGTYMCASTYVPVVCTGEGKKVVNGVCEMGSISCLSSVRMPGTTIRWRNTYEYIWSDGSTQTLIKTETGPCLI